MAAKDVRGLHKVAFDTVRGHSPSVVSKITLGPVLLRATVHHYL